MDQMEVKIHAELVEAKHPPSSQGKFLEDMRLSKEAFWSF